MKVNLNKSMWAVVSVILCILIWEVFAVFTPDFVPHASVVLQSLWEQIAEPDSRKDVIATLLRTLAAFGLATVIGVPLGIFMGSRKWIHALTTGPLDFLRSIPAFVLLPLFLVFFRTGETARIAMAAFGAGLIILANTSFGTSHVKRLRLDVAKTYGASNWYLIWGIVFRETLPQILDGARIALSLSLILTIVSEIMLGARYGLGTRVNDSLAGFDLPQMYSLILMIGLLGYVLNRIAEFWTKRLGNYGKHL